MPDTTPSEALNQAMEELLQEPKQELLLAWSEPVPALHAAIHEECRAAGTADEIWTALGLPQPREGLKLEFAAPPGEWLDVLRAWDYTYSEHDRVGGVAQSTAALVPVLGPMAGAISAEVLEEAFPKALLATRSELHLPLALWPAALEKLRAERLLTPMRGLPGISKFHPALLWIARRTLGEDAALHEVVWRLFANVHAELAGIAYSGFQSASAPATAALERLTAQRENFIAAFRYLVARHRPTRARPLLDLLKVIELERPPSPRTPAGDLQTHVARLYAWASCHPQGEFCPAQEREDLAKAWLELGTTAPEYIPPEHLSPTIPLLTEEPNLLLRAQLQEAKLRTLDSPSREEGLKAARLWMTAGDSSRAVELALDAFADGEAIGEHTRSCLVEIATHLGKDGQPWPALRAMLCVHRLLWLQSKGGGSADLSAISLQVRELFSKAILGPTTFEDAMLLEEGTLWFLSEDSEGRSENYLKPMLVALVRTQAPDSHQVVRLAETLSNGAYPDLALPLLAYSVLRTDSAPVLDDIGEWVNVTASAAAAQLRLIGQSEDSSITLQEKAEHVLLTLKLVAKELRDSTPRTWSRNIIQGISLIADARAERLSLRGGDEIFLNFTAVLWAAGTLQKKTLSDSAAALGWEVEPFCENLRSRVEKLGELLTD